MQIPKALQHLLRDIDDLILLPGNPRQGDVGQISLSLERFGQLKPIVVNEDGVILAGNHTYLAAKALGWKQVAAVTAGLEGREQTAFALADNRLSDLATYDHQALLDMATGLDDLTGTGYDLDDVNALNHLVETPLWEDMNIGDVGDSPTVTRTFHIPSSMVGGVDEAVAAVKRDQDVSAGEALAHLVTNGCP